MQHRPYIPVFTHSLCVCVCVCLRLYMIFVSFSICNLLNSIHTHRILEQFHIFHCPKCVLCVCLFVFMFMCVFHCKALALIFRSYLQYIQNVRDNSNTTNNSTVQYSTNIISIHSISLSILASHTFTLKTNTKHNILSVVSECVHIFIYLFLWDAHQFYFLLVECENVSVLLAHKQTSCIHSLFNKIHNMYTK